MAKCHSPKRRSFFTCADGCIAHDQIHLQSHLLNLIPQEKCWHECSASKLVSRLLKRWTSPLDIRAGMSYSTCGAAKLSSFSSILLHISRQQLTCLQISCFFQQMPRTLPILWDGGGVADNCSCVGWVELWKVENSGLITHWKLR